MESLKTKKAIFYPTEIVLLRRKGNITIHVDDISSITYDKPRAIDYLFGVGMPKAFTIFFNKKIEGFRDCCILSIELKDVQKIQEFFEMGISII